MSPADPSVPRADLRLRYAREGWVPLRWEDGVVVIGSSGRSSPRRDARISAVVDAPIRIESMSQRDIVETIVESFSEELVESAADGLYQQDPGLSAREVLSRGQKAWALLGLIVLVGLVVLWPIGTVVSIVAVASVIFLASTLFKFSVALRGSRFDLVRRVSDDEIRAVRDEDLPIYSVLVPVFREAGVVGRLVANLGRLDYPAHKLEIIVLVEEEDVETREAIEASHPPENFVVVTVPKGSPQTKPRACNVGLEVARGEFLVIYDAEDAPEPDQLKKTIVAFSHASPETVVMQAALNYFNARENVLTRLFTLEYSYWFDYMLAGLDVRDLPIPLGGTSNHFRTRALRELGGWDPYNVTEDADLGIRASALGYRVGVVDSTTMEEATSAIGIFIGQRSRWIKGYMQTALVHARRPGTLIRQIGLRRFGSFALLIAGTPLTFLGVIPFSILLVASLVLAGWSIAPVFPPIVLWLSLLNFLIGNALMIYLNMMGPFKRGAFSLVGWAILNPAYWLLHSVASYKALWQLITKPHYWQKTEHGTSAFELHEDGTATPGTVAPAGSSRTGDRAVAPG